MVISGVKVVGRRDAARSSYKLSLEVYVNLSLNDSGQGRLYREFDFSMGQRHTQAPLALFSADVLSMQEC